jgi:hypothetical protein
LDVVHIEKTKVSFELRKALVVELRRWSDQQHEPKFQIEMNDYHGDYDCDAYPYDDDHDYAHHFHDK